MLTEEEYTDGQGEENFCQWYENDLQLAAELGRTLLERNKDLEQQLRNAHLVQQEQQKEIDLLSKQLEVLRNVSESRMKVYEDVDKNLQEVEKTNERLRTEARADKDRVRSLSETVDILEARCAELQGKVTLLEQEQRTRQRETRRALSVPSLVEAGDYQHAIPGGPYGLHEYAGWPSTDEVFGHEKEIKELKHKLKSTQSQLSTEQKKKNQLMTEVGDLVKENRSLEDKIIELGQEQQKIHRLEWELKAMEQASSKICRTCGGPVQSSLYNEPEVALEHDDLQEIPHGEIIRLKNGGSAYGSRESLNTLGLEAEEDMSMMEIMADITAADLASAKKSPSPKRECPSLLGELEEQYRNLVRKYEILVEKKSQAAPVKDTATQHAVTTEQKPSQPSQPRRPTNLAGLQTRASPLDLKSPVDPTQGHFENGPPEYKRLFKEIFDTLRRSVVYEDDNTVRAQISKEELEEVAGPEDDGARTC